MALSITNPRPVSRWWVGVLCSAVLVGCSSKGGVSATCIEVGTVDGQPIPGHIYFEALVKEHGGQFAKTFAESLVLQRRAAQHNLTVDPQVLAARNEVMEREMISSHGGKSAALDHLKRYGLTLSDWRRITSNRLSTELLTLAVMRKAPTDELLTKFFERKYGKNGERRRVRYLLISKDPKNQSVVAPKEIETAREPFVKGVRDVLEQVREGRIDVSALQVAFGNIPYVYETGLVASAITLTDQKRLQEKPKGTWTEIIDNEKFLVIYRKTTLNEQGIAAIDRVKVGVGDADIVAAVFGDELQQRASKKAEELFGKVNGGGKFTLLARTHSDHSVSKIRGGLFRVFEKDNADLGEKATAQILKLRKTGSIAMVEDARGFHIVKLEKYSSVTMDGVKKALAAELSRRVFDEVELATFREQLVSASKVEIKPTLQKHCLPKASK